MAAKNSLAWRLSHFLNGDASNIIGPNCRVDLVSRELSLHSLVTTIAKEIASDFSPLLYKRVILFDRVITKKQETALLHSGALTLIGDCCMTWRFKKKNNATTMVPVCGV